MGGGNGTCDAVIDVFKDPAQIGMTVRVKLNDPATPLAFVEYQVPAHDLRAFAQFVLRKLREAQP